MYERRSHDLRSNPASMLAARIASALLTAAIIAQHAAPARAEPTALAAAGQRPELGVASAAATRGTAPKRLSLSVGQTHVLNEKNVKRIAVGNGKVLQATALDARQVLLIPEAAGSSTVHLWHRDGTESTWQVEVALGEPGRIADELRGLLAGSPNLAVRTIGDKIVIEGNQLTREQTAMLGELTKRFPQVVNLASKVELERMIGMDVRILEIKRSTLENIGIKWRTAGNNGPSFGVVGDFHRSTGLTPGGGAGGRLDAAGGEAIQLFPRISPFATALSWVTSFTSALNLAVQRGEAVVLAEPRLSCRSGGSARFVAGGEIPIPHASGLGTTSIVFKEFGIKFDVSPVADLNDNISARVATEISSINNEIRVNDVPGLNKNRTETEVNMRENEILVISGLFTDDISRTVDKVAGLGDVPVLGRLFRSREFRERQSELVVLIQPYFMQGEAPSTSVARQGLERRYREARESVRMLD